MAATLVGLVSGIVGAVIALIGSIVGDRRRARAEAERWRLDQLSAAYHSALRHLLRLADGHPTAARPVPGKLPKEVIPKEGFREWLADLAEARFWLHAFTASCDVKHLNDMNQALLKFDQGLSKSRGGIAHFFGPPDDIEISWIRGAVEEVIGILTRCARDALAVNDSSMPRQRD